MDVKHWLAARFLENRYSVVFLDVGERWAVASLRGAEARAAAAVCARQLWHKRRGTAGDSCICLPAF